MSPWGPLAERFESERPRKLLALDGGGIRGILTLEVLARSRAFSPYKLSWKTGEKNLLLISVGTGAAPTLDG